MLEWPMIIERWDEQKPWEDQMRVRNGSRKEKPSERTTYSRLNNFHQGKGLNFISSAWRGIWLLPYYLWGRVMCPTSWKSRSETTPLPNTIKENGGKSSGETGR